MVQLDIYSRYDNTNYELLKTDKEENYMLRRINMELIICGGILFVLFFLHLLNTCGKQNEV